MKDNSNDQGIWATILTVLAVLFAVALITKFFKELKSTSSDDIISDEGKDILNDPDKRKILRNAIDQYHQKGNWEGLNELKP